MRLAAVARQLLLAAAAIASAAGCATVQQPVTKLVNGKVVVTRAVSPDAYEHVTRALLYEEEERWDEAATELQRALPFDDDAAEVRAHLAELFVRLGRLDDAAEQADRSLEIARTVDGWLARAHIEAARDHDAAELQALQQAVATAEADADHEGANAESSERAHLALTEAQIAALDIDAARDTCRRLVRASPDTLRGRVQYAAVSWALGSIEEAEQALRGALEEEPADIDARLLLAELLAAKGDLGAAKAGFKEAIDRSDAPLEIAEAFVGWLAARGDRGEAAELAERMTSDGGDADTLVLMSRIERAAKRPERARALAERALKAGASPGRVAILNALAASDAGDHAGAVAKLMSVAADAPELVEARLRAAELLREDGKVAEADQALVGAAAAAAAPPAPTPGGSGRPGAPPPAGAKGGGAAGKGKDKGQAGKPALTDAEIQLAIARSLVDEKRGDAALAARRLDQALAQSPDDARLLIARAGVEERRGEWRRALGYAEKLLRQDRRSVEALNFLGFVAVDHGDDLPRALKRLQAAAILNPGTGAIIDSLGWAYFRGGDLPRAALFLEQAGRLEPGDAEILEHLGDLYARRQDQDAAVQAYRKALTLTPGDRLARDLQERIRTLDAKSAAGR